MNQQIVGGSIAKKIWKRETSFFLGLNLLWGLRIGFTLRYIEFYIFLEANM